MSALLSFVLTLTEDERLKSSRKDSKIPPVDGRVVFLGEDGDHPVVAVLVHGILFSEREV